MTSVPARGPHADSANSAASRLPKNRFSYHDARYNDLAGWVEQQRALHVNSDAGRGIHNRHCFGAIGVTLSRGIYDAIRPTATKR